MPRPFLFLILLVTTAKACNETLTDPGKRHVGEEILIVPKAGFAQCQEQCLHNYWCVGITHNFKTGKCHLFSYIVGKTVDKGSVSVTCYNDEEILDRHKRDEGSGPDISTEYINDEFLREKEGFETDGYVPSGDNSGVTIGSGVDLGSKNRDYFSDLGVPDDIIDTLEPYFGLKGQDAIDELDENPLSLSEAEAEDLTKRVMDKEVERTSQRYDDAIDDSKKNFDDLTTAQRTVIASVLFQYGSPGKVPKFWEHVTNQDWDAAIEELRDFSDSYPTRRNSEADLLESEMHAEDNPERSIGKKLSLSRSVNASTTSTGSDSLATSQDTPPSSVDDHETSTQPPTTSQPLTITGPKHEPNIISWACDAKKFPGKTFDGTKLGENFFASGPENCCNKCDSVATPAQCVGFTFDKATSTCQLYSAIQRKANAMNIYDAYACQRRIKTVWTCNPDKTENRKIQGMEIKPSRFTLSPDECCGWCDADPTCLGFTFEKDKCICRLYSKIKRIRNDHWFDTYECQPSPDLPVLTEVFHIRIRLPAAIFDSQMSDPESLIFLTWSTACVNVVLFMLQFQFSGLHMTISNFFLEQGSVIVNFDIIIDVTNQSDLQIPHSVMQRCIQEIWSNISTSTDSYINEQFHSLFGGEVDFDSIIVQEPRQDTYDPVVPATHESSTNLSPLLTAIVGLLAVIITAVVLFLIVNMYVRRKHSTIKAQGNSHVFAPRWHVDNPWRPLRVKDFSSKGPDGSKIKQSANVWWTREWNPLQTFNLSDPEKQPCEKSGQVGQA